MRFDPWLQVFVYRLSSTSAQGGASMSRIVDAHDVYIKSFCIKLA